MTGRIRIGLLGFWLGAHVGCTAVHVEGGADPSAAGGPSGAPRTSLCTPERDPTGLRCAAHAGNISSLDALALARERVPDAPLIHLRSDGVSSLNLDGLDTGWEFRFRQRFTGNWILVRVDVDGVRDYRSDGNRCSMEGGIRPLDSEVVVPDAVQRLETISGHPFVGNLYMEQDGCPQQGAPEHFVMLRPEGPSAGPYLVRYFDDGRFIGVRGPCMTSDLRLCAKGESP